MPLWYAGAVEEHLAVRRSAGLFDISHMGRFEVRGAGSGAALASLFTRDPRRLEIHASSYCFACNDQGGIVDDLILYRLAEDGYLVICNAANAGVIGEALRLTAGASLEVNDVQSRTVLLAVQGPGAVEQLAGVCGTDLSSIPRRTSAEVSASGRNLFLARTGYTGEDGFEVMASPEDGGWLLDRLVEAGVKPCGLAARDSLRLEAALPLHGHDIDETTTPWEAGLGWAVELDHEFRGREALAASRAATSRRLLCILADAAGVMRPGNPVYRGDVQAGVLTSGGHSPILGKSIGMAYLPRAVPREGAQLTVEVRGRRIPAHTVKRPFVSPPGAG